MFWIIFFLVHFFILFPLGIIALILEHKLKYQLKITIKDLLEYILTSLIPLVNIGFIWFIFLDMIGKLYNQFSKTDFARKELF